MPPPPPPRPSRKWLRVSGRPAGRQLCLSSAFSAVHSHQRLHHSWERLRQVAAATVDSCAPGVCPRQTPRKSATSAASAIFFFPPALILKGQREGAVSCSSRNIDAFSAFVPPANSSVSKPTPEVIHCCFSSPADKNQSPSSAERHDWLLFSHLLPVCFHGFHFS